MARIINVVLPDHPADITGPCSINRYLVEVQDAAALGEDGKKFKTNPQSRRICIYSRRSGSISSQPCSLAR